MDCSQKPKIPFAKHLFGKVAMEQGLRSLVLRCCTTVPCNKDCMYKTENNMPPLQHKCVCMYAILLSIYQNMIVKIIVSKCEELANLLLILYACLKSYKELNNSVFLIFHHHKLFALIWTSKEN